MPILQLQVLSIYKLLVLMAFIQYTILRKQENIDSTVCRQGKYWSLILLNAFIHFTFAGLNHIFFISLTRFIYTEMDYFLFLLGLKEIRFWNSLQVTSEEFLAIVLVKLFCSNRYWQMMDCFGHSQTWLSIIFNETMI